MPPRMHKSHRFDIKNPKIFWGGGWGFAPSPDLTPSGEGDTPSPHPTPAPRFSRRSRRLAGWLIVPLKISGYATGVLYHLFTIAGTNPYSWTLTDPRGSIILNKCDNALGFPSEYESNLTYVQQTYNVTVGLD